MVEFRLAFGQSPPRDDAQESSFGSDVPDRPAVNWRGNCTTQHTWQQLGPGHSTLGSNWQGNCTTQHTWQQLGNAHLAATGEATTQRTWQQLGPGHSTAHLAATGPWAQHSTLGSNWAQHTWQQLGTTHLAPTGQSTLGTNWALSAIHCAPSSQ